MRGNPHLEWHRHRGRSRRRSSSKSGQDPCGDADEAATHCSSILNEPKPPLVLCVNGSAADRSLTQTRRSPEKPGRFTVLRDGQLAGMIGLDNIEAFLTIETAMQAQGDERRNAARVAGKTVG